MNKNENNNQGYFDSTMQTSVGTKVDYINVKHHTIDPVHLRQHRVVSLQHSSFESDIFRLLRTKIVNQLKENSWNSFGISAPTQGAGKTMVSVNLAIAMAMDINQSVLLIDMDLVHPNVDTYFDIKVKNGLSDYINSNIPLSELLINPGIERLLILPGKGRVARSSEMLSTPKMFNLINQIKKDNPSMIIIFDLPPVLAADDVLASSRYYDAMLLVIEEGGNKPDEVTQSLQMLSGIPLLGTVLNKSEHLPNYQRYYYAKKK